LIIQLIYFIVLIYLAYSFLIVYRFAYAFDCREQNQVVQNHTEKYKRRKWLYERVACTGWLFWLRKTLLIKSYIIINAFEQGFSAL